MDAAFVVEVAARECQRKLALAQRLEADGARLGPRRVQRKTASEGLGDAPPALSLALGLRGNARELVEHPPLRQCGGESSTHALERRIAQLLGESVGVDTARPTAQWRFVRMRPPAGGGHTGRGWLSERLRLCTIIAFYSMCLKFHHSVKFLML